MLCKKQEITVYFSAPSTLKPKPWTTKAANSTSSGRSALPGVEERTVAAGYEELGSRGFERGGPALCEPALAPARKTISAALLL